MANQDHPPFFIVGCGRSGSTLLRLILSRHSRLAIPPETKFYLDLAPELPLVQPLSENQVRRACALVTAREQWSDFSLSEDEFESRALALPRPTLRDVVDLIYDDYRRAKGKPRWGDKTPGYLRIATELAEIYPEAKFIYLVRDGRDVAKSFHDVGWGGPGWDTYVAPWTEIVDEYLGRLQGPLRDRFLRVRYEDLVTRLEASVREICKFLAEDFEPRMLKWEGDDGFEVRVPTIHQKIHRRPDRGDVNRWRRELTARQLWIVESFAREQLEASGYPLYYSSPLWRPFMALTRGVARSSRAEG